MLAELDYEHAEAHLLRAVELAPFDSQNMVRLALELEMKGRVGEAHHWLQEAERVDRTLAPQWSLVNFYYRRQQWDRFWKHARCAAAIPHADLGGLYDLCLRVRPEPDSLMETLKVNQPDALRQLLESAIKHKLASASLKVGELAATNRGEKVRAALLDALEQVIQGRNRAAAIHYWNLLARHRHISLDPVEEPGVVNGAFGGEMAGTGFDWRALRAAGVEIRGRNGVLIKFTGSQAADLILLTQRVPLAPNCPYRLQYRYRSDLNVMGAPVYWRAGGAEGRPLTGPGWREDTMDFTARDEWINVELATRRQAGTVRPEGEVEIAWIRLEGLPCGSQKSK
jgi:hypothetical protein